ncbi:MAG: hypothetical protein O7B30_06390 [Thaumarchaeota archaeon]|nr:hypothetical protein [Nitrososphaerota archaeon]
MSDPKIIEPDQTKDSQSASVIERFGLRPSRSIEDPIEREREYRKTLGRLLISALILLTTTLLLLVIPLYPTPVIILFGILSALIGFRVPIAGFLIGTLVSAPAYAYQAGIPLWWLFVYIFFIGAFAARSVSEPRNVISPLMGLFAGALGLTPLYFAAIPLMLMVALLEERRKLFDHLGMVFMFIMIFIPFHGVAFSENLVLTLGDQINSMRPQQIYDAMNALPLPLFTQIFYTPNPSLTSLDIPTLQATFSSAFGASEFFHPYLFLIIDRLIILYVPILLALSFSFISVVDRFWPWLVERGIDVRKVLKYSYAPTLLVGTFLFLGALQATSGTLRYYTSLNPIATETAALSGGVSFLAITVSAVSFGSAMVIGSLRLRRREEVAFLSSGLISKGRKLADSIASFFTSLKLIERSSPGIDLSTENASASKYQEQVRITLGGIGTMSYKTLRERTTSLSQINEEQERIASSTYHRLYQYQVDKVVKYQNVVSTITRFGIEPGGLPNVNSISVSDLAEMGHEESLKRQEELNIKFLKVAEITVEFAARLIEAIRKDFDIKSDPTAVDVARNFLAESAGERALDPIVTSISSLSNRYLSDSHKIASSVRKLIQRMLEIYNAHILPLNESLGREASVSKTAQVAIELSNHVHQLEKPKGIIYLPDIMLKLEYLEIGTRSILGELLTLLRDFEKLNDSRVSEEFNWGKNTQLVGDIDSSLRFLDDQEANEIDERIDNIEYVIKTIEGAAATLKKYITMNEFILNYPNMEPLIISKLHKSGHVSARELPVRPRYASQYLKLFAINRYGEVVFDSKYSKIQRRKK